MLLFHWLISLRLGDSRMTPSLEKVSGFFRIEIHSCTGRALWASVVVGSIILIVLTILALVFDFFHIRQAASTTLAIVVVVGVMLFLPGVVLAIALPKSLKRPGRYLHGIRITSRGIEPGILQLDGNQANQCSSREASNFYQQQAAGFWRATASIQDRPSEVMLGLRLQDIPAGAVRFEHLSILVGSRIVLRLYARGPNENCWQDLVIVDEGVVYPIESREAMDCSAFLRILEKIAKVLALGLQPPPSCNLKFFTGDVGKHNPLATGILGAFGSSEGTSGKAGKFADYFDEQTARRLDRFFTDMRWQYCLSK